MDRSYPFSRRIERRLRFQRRALATMSAGIAACALSYGMMPEPAPYAAPATLAAAPVAVAPPKPGTAPAARRVYRHSVVPGGAFDREELARVVRTDKLVAAHYADFDVARARPVTVPAPRAVYVSYRKGDRIYWTSKKVMLQAGETLLTDGLNEMRARCANRISDLPRFPVEKDAPDPETLDRLVNDEPEGTGSSITFVGMPEFEDDLPRLGDRPQPPNWPGNAPPRAADTPQPARPPSGDAPAPGLSWPPMGWYGSPGLPPLVVHTPDTQLLASVTPPPLARWTSVAPDPLLDAGPGAPLPPPVVDLEPFVPQPDPGQPTPPPNPTLDPPPSHVPEPSSAWLVAGALLTMLVRRKRRRLPPRLTE